jgi:hypothetical protein
MSIKQNLSAIEASLPGNVTLVAVSKTKSYKEILEAYECGQRDFGENKVQEMNEKWEVLPKDIRWHMIGHLQRNKVKYIAPYVSLIHGVDSMKLLQEINKRAGQHKRVIPCLLQVHIAREENKFGFDAKELQALIPSEEFGKLTNVQVKGLMGMATFTEDEDRIRQEFRYLKSLFDHWKLEVPGMQILSMGMSSDYRIAIEEGSTMVRIGSSIFGARNYD